MDHSWGRNVFDYGLDGIGATLATHMHNLGPGYVLTNTERFFPMVFFVRIPQDTGLGFYLGGTIPKLAAGNFPYGYTVDADVPL